MADDKKFAGLSAEVMAACSRYSAEEVDRAAFALLRGKARPHIGDVYDALERARDASAPAKETGARSTWNDLALVIAWVMGNACRWIDWQPELGEKPHDAESIFVPEAKLKSFALGAAGRIRVDFDDLVWKANDRDWRGKGFQRELVLRIRHGLNHGMEKDRARERMAELSSA